VTNFAFLEPHDPQLVRLGMLAERYFPDDPNTSLLKLRQFGELLAQLVAAQMGEFSVGGRAVGPAAAAARPGFAAPAHSFCTWLPDAC
jgi:hypothetical protein